MLSRRDQFAQAASYWEALRTQVWTLPEVHASPMARPAYNYAELRDALQKVVMQDWQIRQHLAETGCQYLEVNYERYVADRRATLNSIVEFLHLPPRQITLGASLRSTEDSLTLETRRAASAKTSSWREPRTSEHGGFGGRVPSAWAWDSRTLAYPRFSKCRYTAQPGAYCLISTGEQQLHLPMVHHGWSGIVSVTADQASPIRWTYSPPSLPAISSHFIGTTLGRTASAWSSKVGGIRGHRGNEFFLGEPSAQYWPAASEKPGAGAGPAHCHGSEGRFLLTEHDSTISRQLLRGEPWAPEETALLSRLVRPDWVCVDCRGRTSDNHTVALARRLTGGGPRDRL